MKFTYTCLSEPCKDQTHNPNSIWEQKQTTKQLQLSHHLGLERSQWWVVRRLIFTRQTFGLDSLMFTYNTWRFPNLHVYSISPIPPRPQDSTKSSMLFVNYELLSVSKESCFSVNRSSGSPYAHILWFCGQYFYSIFIVNAPVTTNHRLPEIFGM